MELMQLRNVIAILLLLLAVATEVTAKTHRAFNGRVMGGDCVMKSDPNIPAAKPWPAFCFKARVGSEILLRQNPEIQNLGLVHGNIYAGVHVSNYFSFHAAGIKRRLGEFEQINNSTIVEDDQITESLFMQAGNKTLTRFSLAFGRMDLPFGINHRPLMEVYNVGLKAYDYWDFPEYAANFTFDNQVESRLEVAVASNNFAFGADKDTRNRRSREGSTNRKKNRTREAFAIRSSYDLSALEGTRITLSLYEEREQPRRFGVAFLNQGANGRQSSFEWIRIGTYFRPDVDFRQMFRVAHATGFRARSRTLFEFELDHKRHRILTLGMDRRILSPLIMLRASMSYFWEDEPNSDDEDYFMLALGTEAKL